MIKLLKQLIAPASKVRPLRSFLDLKFEEDLMPIDMPHVGAYRQGSLTKKSK